MIDVNKHSRNTMLYIEQNDIHLTMFPEGDFSHRLMSAEDAKARIDAAKADDQNRTGQFQIPCVCNTRFINRIFLEAWR